MKELIDKIKLLGSEYSFPFVLFQDEYYRIVLTEWTFKDEHHHFKFIIESNAGRDAMTRTTWLPVNAYHLDDNGVWGLIEGKEMDRSYHDLIRSFITRIVELETC